MFSHPVGSFLLLHLSGKWNYWSHLEPQDGSLLRVLSCIHSLSGKWKLLSHLELLNVFSPCQFFLYPPPQWLTEILITFRTIGWSLLTIESSFMHFLYHHNEFFQGSSNSVTNGNSFKIWNNWVDCEFFHVSS